MNLFFFFFKWDTSIQKQRYVFCFVVSCSVLERLAIEIVYLASHIMELDVFQLVVLILAEKYT